MKTGVKMTVEQVEKELDDVTDSQAASIWNILQWQLRGGLDVTAKMIAMDRILSRRGIPHEVGKLTNRR